MHQFSKYQMFLTLCKLRNSNLRYAIFERLKWNSIFECSDDVHV